LIVSYLYDPDRVFENNLRLCGVENLICGPAKIGSGKHAAQQLARPLDELGLCVEDFAAKIFPSKADRSAAEDFLRPSRKPLVVFHPGSGSETKNWPLENWILIGNRLLAEKDFQGSIVLVSGEADEVQAGQLRGIWKTGRVQLARNLPLPVLAALFENTIFLGHDSGISHLAAAAGANCILMFGPTDPAVWAPVSPSGQIIRAPQNDLRELAVEPVHAALSQALMRIGMST
jgi:heptosyltransferase-2